jgi:hypothetical protein
MQRAVKPKIIFSRTLPAVNSGVESLETITPPHHILVARFDSPLYSAMGSQIAEPYNMYSRESYLTEQVKHFPVWMSLSKASETHLCM